MDFKAKISILEDIYDFKITEEVEEEVDRMCNLSEGIWEKGMAKGMEKGMAKGIAKGKAEGQLLQLVHDVEKLLSKGMKFDEATDLLDITPDSANKIRKMLNK